MSEKVIKQDQQETREVTFGPHIEESHLNKSTDFFFSETRRKEAWMLLHG